jgi:hypothetical protein
MPNSSPKMRLKRMTTRAGPSLRAEEDGARPSAVRKLLRGRSGTGLACRSYSSNRWSASSGRSIPAQTRSFATAKAVLGAQGGEVDGVVEEEEEERRRPQRRGLGAAGGGDKGRTLTSGCRRRGE